MRRSRTRRRSRPAPQALSPPSEHWLLEPADPALLTCSALESDPSELDEERAGWCMNQIAAERNLHDWSITLGDSDKTWGVVAAEFV